MQLVEKHIIKKTNKFYKELDSLSFLSKNLYNATLYQIRHHFFETKKMINYPELQKIFQDTDQYDYRMLPSKVAQWIMKMVFQNFRSFFNSLTDYKKNPEKYKAKPRIPKYLDKKNGRYMLIYTIQAISKREAVNGIIHLSGTDVRIKTNLKYENIAQIRVTRQTNSYTIEVVHNKACMAKIADNGRYAAIDLGVNNLAVVVSNIKGWRPFSISGKKVKSINHIYNKELAKSKSILETRNKSKSSKHINTITFKKNNRINDYMHKASRYIVNQLIDSNISTLVIGNNKEWKQDMNIGKVNNQNFVQIPHSTLISMLKYKCELAGIEVVINEESYTSKCSFLDMEEIGKHETYYGKRIKRGLFKSSNGTLINADVNGAYNILRKCKPNAFADGVKGVVVHPVLIKRMK